MMPADGEARTRAAALYSGLKASAWRACWAASSCSARPIVLWAKLKASETNWQCQAFAPLADTTPSGETRKPASGDHRCKVAACGLRPSSECPNGGRVVVPHPQRGAPLRIDEEL